MAHARAAKAEKAIVEAARRCDEKDAALEQALTSRALRVLPAGRAGQSAEGRLALVCRDGAFGHQRLTLHAWQRISYEYPTAASDGTLAAIYAVTRPTIRAVRETTAFVRWRAQQQLLDQAGADAKRLAFAVWALASDCTPKLLLASRPHAFSARKERNRFEVLVSTSTLVCGALAPQGAYGGCQASTLLRPPVALTSQTGEALVQGLFVAKFVAEQSAACLRVLARAHLGVLHLGSDDCGAVQRMGELIMTALPHLLVSHKNCSLHNNDHIKGALLKDFLPEVNRLYALNRLCKYGVNFRNVVRSVPHVVVRHTDIVPGVPPPEATAFCDEVLAYAVLHYELSRYERAKPGAGAAEQAGKKETEGLRAFKQAGHDLFRNVLNGQLWLGLVHFCQGPQCCQNFTPHITHRRVVEGLQAFVFAGPPGAPEVGKWTKLGPAVDKAVVGYLVGAVYPKSFGHAFSPDAARDYALPIDGMEVDLEEEVAWAASVGQVATTVVRFLSDVGTGPALVVLALALEPVRLLMRCLFTLSGGARREMRPSMAVWANPASSPTRPVLQYVSSLLAPASLSRVLLLWRPLGCADLEAFYQNEARHVTRLGDALFTVSGWIWRSHVFAVASWPWPLTVLGDASAAPAAKWDILMRFLDARPGDLDPGFGRRLQPRLPADPADALDDPAWAAFWVEWAHAVDPTNAQIEFRSARNNKAAPHKDTSVATFVTKAFQAEALSAHEAARAADDDAAATAASAQPRAPAPLTPPPLKGTSALQIFHRRWLRREAAAGNPVHATAGGVWEHVTWLWEHEPPESAERLFCEAQAAAESAQARAAKVRAMTARHGPVVPGLAAAAEAAGRLETGGAAEVRPLPWNPGATGPNTHPTCAADCAPENLVNQRFTDTWRAWREGVAHPFRGGAGRLPFELGGVPPAAARDVFARAHAPLPLRTLAAYLLEVLEGLLRAFKKQVGVLVSYAAGAAADNYRFHLVCGWLHKAGRHPFRVNLAPCEVSRAGAEELLLRPVRRERAEPRHDEIDPRFRAVVFERPVSQAGEGALQHEAEAEWALALLSRLAPQGAGVEGLDLRLRFAAVLQRPAFDTFRVRRPSPDVPADAWATPEVFGGPRPLGSRFSGGAARPGGPRCRPARPGRRQFFLYFPRDSASSLRPSGPRHRPARADRRRTEG